MSALATLRTRCRGRRKVFLLIFASSLAEGQAVPTASASGLPSCASCQVVLERVFTITDIGDSIAIQENLAPVLDTRGRVFFHSAGGARGIVVFDSTGRFVSRFGRTGSGPGEFGGLGQILFVGRGDTLFVCGALKCQLFSPDFRFVRSFATVPGSVTSAAATLSSGDIAIRLNAPPGTELSRNPIHRMSTSGVILSSFGADALTAQKGTANAPSPTCLYCGAATGLGIAGNGTDVWMAPAGRYELQLRSSQGQLRRRIVIVNSPWFVPWDPSDRTATVMSVVQKIMEGPDGVLFIFGRGAEKSNDSAAPAAGARATVRGGRSGAQAAVVRTPVIEAIDVSSGVVLASLKVPGVYFSMFGGNFVTSVREGRGATQYVDVWRVVLKR